VYRFAVDRACAIALREIRDHLVRATTVSSIILVAFSDEVLSALRDTAGGT
jgi:O-acetyl-ADP-ribose deacetylase (regulator of RNase III)